MSLLLKECRICKCKNLINIISLKDQVITSKIIKNTIYNNTQPESMIALERGAELGHFRMGSTVIVLFPKDKMRWSEELQPSDTVRMGQLLGIMEC